MARAACLVLAGITFAMGACSKPEPYLSFKAEAESKFLAACDNAMVQVYRFPVHRVSAVVPNRLATYAELAKDDNRSVPSYDLELIKEGRESPVIFSADINLEDMPIGTGPTISASSLFEYVSADGALFDVDKQANARNI